MKTHSGSVCPRRDRAYGRPNDLHEAVAQYEVQYGLKGGVDSSHLYGEGDHYDIVTLLPRDQTLCRCDQDVECVTNWGTGEATREFLYAADAAEAIRLATFNLTHSRPVNIGTGIETSIKSLAQQIAEIVGFNGQIKWDPSKPSGQPRRCLTTDRAKGFGFEASVSLRDGLTRTIDDYKARFR